MNKELNVSELIAVLNNFHGEMPVLAAWEGVFVPITEDDIGINLVSPYSGKIKDAVILLVDQA